MCKSRFDGTRELQRKDKECIWEAWVGPVGGQSFHSSSCGKHLPCFASPPASHRAMAYLAMADDTEAP